MLLLLRRPCVHDRGRLASKVESNRSSCVGVCLWCLRQCRRQKKHTPRYGCCRCWLLCQLCANDELHHPPKMMNHIIDSCPLTKLAHCRPNSTTRTHGLCLRPDQTLGQNPYMSRLNRQVYDQTNTCRKPERSQPNFVGDRVVDTGLRQSLVGSV